jgi:2-keto-3-deoxy-6-phosphogluconate aldolase
MSRLMRLQDVFAALESVGVVPVVELHDAADAVRLARTLVGAGVRHLKFFPAGAFGGPSTVAALAGPFAATGVQFLPTGGITAANVAEYPSMFLRARAEAVAR